MIDQSYKVIAFDDDARSKISVGVKQLTDAVRVTMGPSGKNVLIERDNAQPTLTKDGVTVARAVNLKDRFANLGVQLVREAASRTAEEAGDGTTTATVLANALYQEGDKLLRAGCDLRVLKDEMGKAIDLLSTQIKDAAEPITNDDELLRVANISVNNEPELAKLIVDALKAVGDHGTVTVDEAKGFQSSLDIVDGCEIDRGYTSPYFVNKPSRMACELLNPAILVTDQRVSSVSHIMHFMEESARENRPFVIIGPEVTGDAMQALIMNTTKNIIKSCVLAAPEFGNARLEALKDLCVLLDTSIMTGDPADWRALKLKDLGKCKKLTSFRFRSIIVDAAGKKEDVAEREEEILFAIKEADDDESRVLKRRLRRLNSGVGILKVGGSTEAEIGERKDRVEDALYATKAAMLEGVVAGGGSLLATLATAHLKKDPNMHAAQRIVFESVCEPLKQIAENCGGNANAIIKQISEKPMGFGYNGITGEVCNLIDQGILDPVKVTRLALQNAFSVAINLLSIGCSMVNDDQDILEK